ncbi:OX2R protein, partial [Amia calva]|nr:OX2R protein [Amia calva]
MDQEGVNGTGLGSGAGFWGGRGQEPNVTAEVRGGRHVDYEEEILRYLWRDYLFPRQYEWVLIAGYIIVFIIALTGNALGCILFQFSLYSLSLSLSLSVCLAVWRNHHMRTVTNYFIVNLSLADLLVTAICLPVSLVVDITESWFFGQTLCKVIPYLQVLDTQDREDSQTDLERWTVLTLSFIALDRWYAICHPLLFKSTARRARHSILLIWVLSLTIMVPQAIVMETSSMIPELANHTLEVYPRVYHICFFMVTYLAPLCLMFIAYFQIFRKLWCRQVRERGKRRRALYIHIHLAEIKQLRARRKTARMLLVVLLVFTLCYLPISLLNVLKRVSGVFDNTADRETVYAWFTFSHWLVYANSAANPIIYNFLSGKFREEFKAAFSCCFQGLRCCQRTESRCTDRSTSQKSLTGSRLSSQASEHVVLASITPTPHTCTEHGTNMY